MGRRGGTFAEYAGVGQGLAHVARDAKIHDFGAAMATDHDVVRLEIAVDDAGSVRGSKTPPSVGKHLQDFGKRPWGREPFVQGQPLDKFHGDEHLIEHKTHVVHGDDIGVR